jgi:hypothetical protein
LFTGEFAWLAGGTPPKTLLCNINSNDIAQTSLLTTRRRSGLEAQRAALERFAEGRTLISEYTEAETGKGADALHASPQLAAALPAARKAKCSI